MAPNRWPDDPLPSGVPYSDLPITNSNCMNKSCNAFAAGWNESEKVIPLMSQIDYSYWTLCYYMFWLVLFVAAHWIHVISNYFTRPRAVGSTPRVRWTHKVAARYRSIAYRRFNGWWTKLGMPSLGLFVLFAATTIFFTALVFHEKPYLRSRFRFGSPPLSVRCAMTISALMPLLIALGGKVNIITWVTGASYAELNIFHQYVGGVVFALATIHTIPHLVAPIKDGGYDYLAQLFIWKRRELSGVILYFIFLVMMVLSIPAVRRRYYEFFAFTHIILGSAFFGVIWWHIKGEYASPIYIYATVGIFVFSNILRIVHRNRSFLRGNPLCKCGWHGALGGFPTKIEQLPGKITKLTVDVPASLRWAPGRHSYIRMPKISIFGNHPFTIASIPSTSPKEPNQLVFLIRAHSGFTSALAQRAALHQAPPAGASGNSSTSSSTSDVALLVEKAEKQLSDLEAQTPGRGISSRGRYSPLRTIVDGTYGTYTGPLHRIYDTIVLIAAGTGITAALPHALDLSVRMREAAVSGDPCAARDVRLVWTVRDEAWVGWVRRELERCVANANEGAARALAWRGLHGGATVMPGRIIVDVYVTGKRETPAPSAMASQATFGGLPSPSPTRKSSQQEMMDNTATTEQRQQQQQQAEEGGPGKPVSSSSMDLTMAVPPPPFFRDTPATRSQADRSRWSSAETIRIDASSPPPPASNCSSFYYSSGGDTATNSPFPSRTPSRIIPGADAGCQCCRRHSRGNKCHSRTASDFWPKTSRLNVKYERPVMRELLPQLVTSLKGGRAFVVGCGPAGLKVELANTVAAMQGRVVRGEMEKVVLHMETFGW